MRKPSKKEPPKPGLRERKKAKTRAAIQRHAFRLFRKRGYDNTTVEEIAEAAEVSPSTFFRYFGTKEDVVLYDVLDPQLIDEFKTQPHGLSPIQALRGAWRELAGKLSSEDLEELRERGELVMKVPELRQKMLDELFRSIQSLSALIGERVGRPADDFAVRSFVGAVMGVGMAAILSASDTANANYLDLMDAAFAQLEAGLPL